MKLAKKIAVLCAVVLCFVLCGCQAIGIDVENQMRPPKNNGEQEPLQNALELYIQENTAKGEKSNYALKYPLEGEYRSSFLLFNQIKAPTIIQPQTENAGSTPKNEALNDYVVAFYRMDTEGAKTHINLLKRENGSWISAADVGGYSEEIAQVDFGDLNGDGFPELIVGWNLYNSNDKRLTIYDVKNGLTLLSSDKIYTTFLIHDFTADAAADIVLLNAAPSEHTASARLFSYQNHQLVLQDLVMLDGGIQRFEQVLVAMPEPGVFSIYADGYKDPHTLVTELIYWKDGRLAAPFHDTVSGLTGETARELLVYCNDVDEDGRVEIPLSTRLPGYETADATQAFWKTTWYSYDITTGELTRKFDSVVNSNDEYVLKLSSHWPETFTVYYHAETRVMSFCETTDSQTVFLEIQANTTGKTADLQEGFTYFDSTGSPYYAVRRKEGTDGFTLSMTEVQYLFSVL